MEAVKRMLALGARISLYHGRIRINDEITEISGDYNHFVNEIMENKAEAVEAINSIIVLMIPSNTLIDIENCLNAEEAGLIEWAKVDSEYIPSKTVFIGIIKDPKLLGMVEEWKKTKAEHGIRKMKYHSAPVNY
jgi:CRISPR/Cas system CMR subunit Cmr4 (Cas7 group RAMP superfamily)